MKCRNKVVSDYVSERDIIRQLGEMGSALHCADRLAAEVNRLDGEPRLGLATTAELLAELQARAEIGGYSGYRTVEET